MKHNYAKGIYTKQAHSNVPEGTYEEEFGRSGFFGDQAQLYRLHPTTDWTRIEGPLKPHAIRTYELAPDDMHDANGHPVTVLFNDDMRLSVSRRGATMPYFFRNGDGDELHFIHKGEGRFECDFGALSFEPGDYILIPKGTNYRFVYETSDNFSLIVESATPFGFPERGVLGQHAPFDFTKLQTPEPAPVEQSEQAEWELRIKKHDQFTSVFYPFCPMDVVGWHGSLTVLKLNTRDLCGVMSDRLHLPPSAHTTFESKGVYVCTFTPRPYETDPAVERVPWAHRNIDYDEVFFTHDGEFTLARPKGSESAATEVMSLNPAGLHHGPHPGVLEKAKKNWQKHARLEFTAINIDTEKPLTMTAAAMAVEVPDLYKTWAVKTKVEEPA